MFIASRSRITSVLLLLAGCAVFCGTLQAQSEGATGCIGDDVADLGAAAEKAPDNIGFQMRLAQKKLAMIRESDVKAAKKYLAEIETHLERMKELGADFVYPYRALAKSYYNRERYDDCLATIAAFRSKDDLDFDLNTLHFHALVRLATREEQPEPQRVREAAEYVATWFDSGTAPPFGTTLGALRAWVIDPTFRTEILQVFADRFKANPKNLNLVVSYIACLAAVGRYETAWAITQDAERLGLCDASTGGRHPVTHLLSMNCPEVPTPESYDGSDIEELKRLAAKYPTNAGLMFRCAASIKFKANVSSKAALLYGERIKRVLKDNAGADVADLQAKQAEHEAKASALYAEALPFVIEVAKLNPDIETVPLMTGDIYFKLKRYDEAIKELRRGLAMVPFFNDLREALAFVYKEKGDWDGMAAEIVEASRRSPCNAAEWDRNAPDSLLPKPKNVRERMIVEMAEKPESRAALIKALEAAIAKEPKNPNFRTYLAMVHYFAGEKAASVAAMRSAELVGICGKDGFEHELATIINARKSW